MSQSASILSARPPTEPKPRAGRPTKAAAVERDERLLDIATRMFLEQGFEATSMDGLAEAAAVGKATLYARYADKGALFVDVLRRRIPQVHGPIEDEFLSALATTDLPTMLKRVGRTLLAKSTSPESVTLGRIIAAQAPRFPDLARLVVREASDRQIGLIEEILAYYAHDHAFVSDDIPMLADLFLSIVIGRASRLALYGMPLDPKSLEVRADAAVALFLRGLLAPQHE
jgi:AcrR family transcriptional regulator